VEFPTISGYVTVVEADQYFDQRLWTQVWDEATAENKLKALIQATRLIDNLSFASAKTDEDQANEFPRNDQDEVPNEIKAACCEIAISLIEGKDPEKEMESVGIASSGFGAVRESKFENTVPEYITNGIPSATAWNFLVPFLRDTNKSITLSRVN
jgi:hypothetical protein